MILVRIEKLINTHLDKDPALKRDMTAMAGKALLIELTGLEQTIWLLPSNDYLAVQNDYAGEPDVTIKGSPFALMKLAKTTDQAPTSFSGDVVISGDLALGQHVQRMLKQLDLDWEELLAEKVGDVAAHQIGNVLRSVSRWTKDSRKSMEQTLSDYIRIEAEMSPQRFEVNDFLDQVEDLRTDLDRLEQRIQRLVALKT